MNYYTKVSLKDQANIIKKHFDIEIGIEKQPDIGQGEHLFLIPHWSKIAPTYNEALQKVLDAIKSTRPFYNWREGKLDTSYLRQSPLKKVIPEIVSAQFGMNHKGESVERMRSNKKEELLFGAYEVGIMLLTHPDRLTKYEDLFIDCSGDEYSYDAGSDFSDAPYFYWGDGKLYFDMKFVDDACGYFGSVSGFGSQLNLESRPLETIENLNFDRAVEIVKKEGYKIFREI